MIEKYEIRAEKKGGDAEYKPTIHALFIVWQKPSSVDPALSEHLAERIPNPRDVCCLFAVRMMSARRYLRHCESNKPFPINRLS